MGDVLRFRRPVNYEELMDAGESFTEAEMCGGASVSIHPRVRFESLPEYVQEVCAAQRDNHCFVSPECPDLGFRLFEDDEFLQPPSGELK